jgi:flagellar biosynthesis/type III secretory pathway protein FliH
MSNPSPGDEIETAIEKAYAEGYKAGQISMRDKVKEWLEDHFDEIKSESIYELPIEEAPK